MEQRITAVVHGSIAAMPCAARRQAERLTAGEPLEHLKEILKALASPDAPSGGERDDPMVTALRAAARQAVKPDANPRAGAEHLAAAIQAVGLDRWPGFVRDVARHAETLTRQAERGKSGSIQAVRAEAAPPFVRSAVEALASAIFSYTLSQTTRRRVLRDHGIDNAAERNYPIHHVVAWKDKRAAEARNIFRRAGIDVHDPVNLLPLRADAHQRVHTNVYYQTVNNDLRTAYATGGRPGIETALGIIKAKLLATGTYP